MILFFFTTLSILTIFFLTEIHRRSSSKVSEEFFPCLFWCLPPKELFQTESLKLVEFICDKIFLNLKSFGHFGEIFQTRNTSLRQEFILKPIDSRSLSSFRYLNKCGKHIRPMVNSSIAAVLIGTSAPWSTAEKFQQCAKLNQIESPKRQIQRQSTHFSGLWHTYMIIEHLRFCW